MDDRLPTDILTELVARKLRVLLQLRELTLRQSSLVASDDLDTLLRVLGAKQRLLEEVHRLDASLTPFRNEDPDQRVWRCEDDRLRCRRAAEQCRHLVEEMKASELEQRTALTERHAAVVRELEHANTATEARSAYCGDAPQHRLDLASEV
jgi:hypothetical protein